MPDANLRAAGRALLKDGQNIVRLTHSNVPGGASPKDCSAGRLLIVADSAATRGRPPVGSCHGRRGAFAVVHWSAE
jgi:hypothetical protein